jgi:hypothetical protein
VRCTKLSVWRRVALLRLPLGGFHLRHDYSVMGLSARQLVEVSRHTYFKVSLQFKELRSLVKGEFVAFHT